MDLFPSLTKYTVDKLEMEEVPGINRNFESFGYSTKLSFINYGSSSFLFIMTPVLALFCKILTAMKIDGVSQRAT